MSKENALDKVECSYSTRSLRQLDRSCVSIFIVMEESGKNIPKEYKVLTTEITQYKDNGVSFLWVYKLGIP